jgi:HlyD family secretion protein
VRSAEAQVRQAQAALKQSEVNLENTIITAPIDGIVLSRAVDVGQTVAASMQAPTLFVLAADLTKMQVLASIDESDIGRIADGQQVTFTVDAYAGRRFEGVVSQIRLQPQTVQNVVTYSVVINAPNRDLTLKPGMTANITIEVARRDDALRVPTAALRFTPAGQSSKGPQVWRSDNGALTPVPVKPGLSDGQFTEVVEGNLSVGETLVVRQSTPNESVRPAATASPFQFMQPQGRGVPGQRRGG